MRAVVARSHKKSLRRAVLMSTICCILSGSLYGEIVLNEKAAVPVLPAIPIGEQYFTILANSDCVGSITSALEYDGSYVLQTKLRLRVYVRGSRQLARVSLTAEFNSLGQLGGSIADLEFAGNAVRFGTTQVNPVQIVVRLNAGQEDERVFRKTVPGPIEIYSENRGNYRIRYRYLPVQSVRESSAGGLPRAFKDLGLKVEQGESAECKSGQYLNLDPMIATIENLATRYRNLIGLLHGGIG